MPLWSCLALILFLLAQTSPEWSLLRNLPLIPQCIAIWPESQDSCQGHQFKDTHKHIKQYIEHILLKMFFSSLVVSISLTLISVSIPDLAGPCLPFQIQTALPQVPGSALSSTHTLYKFMGNKWVNLFTNHGYNTTSTKICISSPHLFPEPKTDMYQQLAGHLHNV